ncbi:MAG TPA: hypothetical protein VN039_09420 [Nitrospira sp.]|nr:hypothetical protein [Nitrospira sp.]
MVKNYIAIVFDGPPSHEAGRFIEVNDSHGKSIDIGTWVSRGDGSWELRIAVDKLKDDNDMTIDTSREAVQALIAEALDYAGEDQCGGAELLRETAQTLGETAQTLTAVLDERDEALRSNKNLRHISNANGDWSEKYQAALRRAECAEAGYETMLESLNRVESENAALTAKLDAVKKYADDRAFHARGHLNTVNSGRIADDLRAILADTDEGNEP